MSVEEIGEQQGHEVDQEIPQYVVGEQAPDSMTREVFAGGEPLTEGLVTIYKLVPAILLRDKPTDEMLQMADGRWKLMLDWFENHFTPEGRLDMRRIGACLDRLISESLDSGLEEGGLISIVPESNELQVTDRLTDRRERSAAHPFKDDPRIIGTVHTHPDPSTLSSLDVVGAAAEVGVGLQVMRNDQGTYVLIKEQDVPLKTTIGEQLGIQLKTMRHDILEESKELLGIGCGKLSEKLNSHTGVSNLFGQLGANLMDGRVDNAVELAKSLGLRVFYQDHDVPDGERYLLDEM